MSEERRREKLEIRRTRQHATMNEERRNQETERRRNQRVEITVERRREELPIHQEEDVVINIPNPPNDQGATENVHQQCLESFDPVDGRLEDQEWARDIMRDYASYCSSMKLQTCTICTETWPVIHVRAGSYTCSKCRNNKTKFSMENISKPSPIPEELQGLTMVEKLLICRASPIMRVYKRPGGQRAYKGHCVSVAQNITQIVNVLPKLPSEIDIIVVRKPGENNTHQDFKVRRRKVSEALEYLHEHCPAYTDIVVDNDRLQSLPEDGIPETLTTVYTNENDDVDQDDQGPVQEDQEDQEDDIHATEIPMTFVSPPPNVELEESAVRSAASGDPVMWPSQGEPVNEYRTEGLASMCYPWLFPDGVGDPTVTATPLEEVSFVQRVQHLMRIADFVDGKPVWRFAADETFAFWALDRWHRWTVNSQASYFIKQNPREANITVQELQNLGNDNQLTSKIMRYLGRIRGMPSYWHQRGEELKSIIENKGPSHMFFTFSWPDLHNPHLHRLCGYPPGDASLNARQRKQNICDAGHLTDWLFSVMMKRFMDKWLNELLKAEWMWYRFEFQHRGSIHLHGLARLKFAPEITSLTEIMVVGYQAQREIESCEPNQVAGLQAIIDEGHTAERTVCQFADWLVSASNPNPPAPLGDWHPPLVHPCKKVHNANRDEEDKDYCDLCNMVQTHSCDKNHYC